MNCFLKSQLFQAMKSRSYHQMSIRCPVCETAFSTKRQLDIHTFLCTCTFPDKDIDLKEQPTIPANGDDDNYDPDVSVMSDGDDVGSCDTYLLGNETIETDGDDEISAFDEQEEESDDCEVSENNELLALYSSKYFTMNKRFIIIISLSLTHFI